MKYSHSKTMAVLHKIVKQSESEKCVRCWHHREDIGSNNEHPELCSRCVENVTGDGEERKYA
jgi:isoleucyl-tRNA synthetase